jgi:rhodanese-related sulfurtransferase
MLTFFILPDDASESEAWSKTIDATGSPIAVKDIRTIRASAKDVQELGKEDMPTTLKQMMDAANAAVTRVTPGVARKMMMSVDTVVVDVRDPSEVEESGKIAGAINVSRGMLEFRADPESPYYDKNFTRDKTVLLYCASGGRSALSGKVLMDMGYRNIYNLGGFNDWLENGASMDNAERG